MEQQIPKEKLKNISPIVSQMVLRKLGMFCSERLSIDLYYLIEAINLIIPDLGEPYIKRKYEEQGKDWEQMKKDLDLINKQLNKAKVFYDALEDKSFKKAEKKDPEKAIHHFFIKNVSKIAIMQRKLFDLFIFLIKTSSIQRLQIDSESFKVLEHSNFRKIEAGRRLPPPPSGVVIGEGN